MADKPILTREEVLELLSDRARAGSVSAAVALERALRPHGSEDDDRDEELDRIPGGDGRWEEDSISGRLPPRGGVLCARSGPVGRPPPGPDQAHLSPPEA